MQIILGIIGILIAWIIAAAVANDPACATVSNHIQPIKFIEELLMICWI